MQTLSKLALDAVKWERVSLPKGAYRIQNAERLNQTPLMTGFMDVVDLNQFNDELDCVLKLLGLACGIWVGLQLDLGAVVQVLALRME